MGERKLPEKLGTRILQGPMDWQVIQRRLDNMADIDLAGEFRPSVNASAPRVEVRVTCMRFNRAVTVDLDWTPADTTGENTWSTVIRNIPAGGPYRIETRTVNNPGSIPAGIQHGDRIHRVGVGDIWVIAGQSNAAGYGEGEIEDPADPGVRMFRACEEWAMADHPIHEPTRSRHPLNHDEGRNGHSPWLAFGRHLHKHLNIPIAIVPTALGGSPLSRWDPNAKNPDLYENMLSFIRAACSMRDYSKFDDNDGGPVFVPNPKGELGRIAGIAWHQGCSDTGDEESKTYADRFAGFVEGIRNRLDAPGLPVVTCQLNHCVTVP
ncbi:MAG: hypothetical protein JXR97_02045, partial [Planctomycetes bacterium]|nr:hypothetical protein [Planctomycetota bacterium]